MAREIIGTVSARALRVKMTTNLVTGSVNSIESVFQFDEEWTGLTKTAVFKNAAGQILPMRLVNDKCVVPHEVTDSGIHFSLGVMGAKDGVLVIPTPFVDVRMAQGSYTAPAPPTPDIYLQILNEFAAGTAAVTAATSAVTAATAAINETAPDVKLNALTASEKATVATAEATKAVTAATHAKTSETGAKTSETKSAQAMADFLSMLGTDVATLVGGKIPMTQIPATATQEIYTITNENELVTLVAQKGDLAQLIETVGGKQTITKAWQLLTNDSTTLSNWVIWGTSYAVQAGHSDTAKTAENANAINHHRLVEMSALEFESAVKDPDTYYLVY